MPAWVSATAVSSGKRGSAPASAARSERSKTLPTWGPLPWVIASLQRPEATTGTMCSTVARVRWNWAPTEGSSPARVMAFPPRARTRMGAPAPAAPSGHTSSCTCESYDLRGEPVQHSVEAPSTEEAPSRHIAVAERGQRPREAGGAPPTRAPLEFHRKLPGYEATPLLAADRLAAELAGCEVVAGTYDDAVARSAQEESERCLVISDTSWPGYTDVPGWVIEGYSTIFWEVDDALAEGGRPAPDVVVVQVGVGALAAAAARHYRRGPAMVAVEPTQAACVLASVQAGALVTIPGPHDS